MLTAAGARETGGEQAPAKNSILSADCLEIAVARRMHAPGPNQLAFWTVAELVILGTVWGPHVKHDLERRSRRGTSFDTPTPRLTCGNTNSNALGVKGSQVQILSARRQSGFSQLRGCENPLLLISMVAAAICNGVINGAQRSWTYLTPLTDLTTTGRGFDQAASTGQ